VAEAFLLLTIESHTLASTPMNPVVPSDKLPRTEVWAEDDESVHWAGAFAVYGGHGTTASSTIVYEIEAGKRLGWHTDATEETQYIIAGSGELHMEDGSTYGVGPGSVFAIPTPVNTTSSMSVRKHCAPSRFSPQRCSPRTSTT
jgi:quercetin dioxygenase-like cupin family protein